MLSIIVAVAENGIIGKDNALLWRLSADLKQFKALTTNHVIIMGRKTFDSIGKPLPNRVSVVISRQKDFSIEGTFTANSLENAIEIAKKQKPNDEIFVIGGGEIYQKALEIAQKIYLTEVKISIDGDTFFQKLDTNIWQETNRVAHKADEKNEYDFDFVEFIRR